MLMVNLIEGNILHYALHIEELNDEDPVLLESLPNPLGNGVEFFQMEEDAGGVDQIELAPKPACQGVIEELIERWDARGIGALGRASGRLHAKHVVAEILKVLELGPVVGADIQNRLGSGAFEKACVSFHG